tara:strand:- start:6963 stop:8123 length:1161 start_codon:yes stop_codon:yes gene_type:complete
VVIGKTMRKNSIPVFKPLLGKHEINASTRVLKEGWLGMGKDVDKFEKNISKLLGLKNRKVIATSTGHAALHLALLLLKIKKGDEIIVPSFNNIADFQAILAVGAIPIFCDINNETLCIDESKIEKLITKKTKAIVSMDYALHMANHTKINAIARNNKLRVIHDAAHAFGSSYKGKKVGTFSDILMFSFDPVKTITCIDGGALVVKTAAEEKILRELRLMGQQQSSKVLYKNSRSWTYDVKRLGFRYHLANLHGAIGNAQLKQFNLISRTRKKTSILYDKLLSECKYVYRPKFNVKDIVPFIYYIRVNKKHRKELMAFLKESNVDVGIHWQPGHWFSLLKKYKTKPLPNTDLVGNEIITLPLHTSMSEKDTRYIARQIILFFKKKVN